MIKCLLLKYDFANLKKQFYLTSQNAIFKKVSIFINAQLFKKIIQFFRNREIFHEFFTIFIPQPIFETLNKPTSYCKVENFVNPHCIIIMFTIITFCNLPFSTKWNILAYSPSNRKMIPNVSLVSTLIQNQNHQNQEFTTHGKIFSFCCTSFSQFEK